MINWFDFVTLCTLYWKSADPQRVAKVLDHLIKKYNWEIITAPADTQGYNKIGIKIPDEANIFYIGNIVDTYTIKIQFKNIYSIMELTAWDLGELIEYFASRILEILIQQW